MKLLSIKKKFSKKNYIIKKSPRIYFLSILIKIEKD